MGRRPQYQRGPVRLLLANINSYFMLKYHEKAEAQIRLCLQGTGPELFQIKLDWIGFCLHGTVWNWSRYLPRIFLVWFGTDPNGFKNGHV